MADVATIDVAIVGIAMKGLAVELDDIIDDDAPRAAVVKKQGCCLIMVAVGPSIRRAIMCPKQADMINLICRRESLTI